MKLLLINPSKYDENNKLMKFEYGIFPPLNLLILASLIKDYKKVKVTIIDEFIEDIPFNEKFDLVGITTLFTSSFPRVIEISEQFRGKGVKVVLGGTHVTCTYNDCLEYADSIVVGEAEYAFEHLIDDFLTGKKIKKIYKNDNFINLEKSKPTILDYSLININKYSKIGIFKKSYYFVIETSRGCPMNCTFCTVKKIHGNIQRFKPISSVIDRIRYLKQYYDAVYFNIIDDNFLLSGDYYTELLKELSKENIKFHCEISTQIVRKFELLHLLKKAGCISVFIGFESLNEANLKSVNKYHNKIKEYKEIFTQFKKYDIKICPAFMFGFDNDDINVFSNVIDFLNTVSIQRAIFSILTPFPGTELYTKILKEKRIITNNLSLYDGAKIVFKPDNLTPDQLQEGYWRSYQELYNFKNIFKRLADSNKKDFIFSLCINLRFHHLVNKRIVPYSSGIKRKKCAC